MRIDAIAIGKNPPQDVNVIIEVAIGGEPIKYEMDKEAGTLVVDRFLYTPMRYPGNYGFVPRTLSDDGDPIDVREDVRLYRPRRSRLSLLNSAPAAAWVSSMLLSVSGWV